MKHMMFVFTVDTPEAGLHEQIALIEGVEMVYELAVNHALGSEHPDLVVIIGLDAHLVQESIEALSPGVRTYVHTVWHEQQHIIGVQDIPGSPIVPAARLKAATRIITTDDIPGPLPTGMRPAVVHKDFSSQAGLASYAGIGGMQHLAVLGD